MSITVGSPDDDCSFMVHLGNKGGHYVCSVDLVRDIFRDFKIRRNVTDRCSPFYYIVDATVNGVYGILVQMNNFKDRSI